ncbi:acyclic terpene utilization AtuA family protein [Ferrovibrio sp.]|uniref:acyclic terpene utilization AtuA family protein n=1 Tax=Ferrovibrio sp. TaxID=1917215 RepID=UPI0025BF3A2C|nr:acyclic terpene utilization AtuA family protein [Ferrovibrio sp.]MBX3452927.1 DUF1446 domain-containing protein [Ferrovibrio sp.]
MNGPAVIRIGCGGGFWGDSAEGPRQLVLSGGIDYLIMDYLAEVTMSLLVRAKAKAPELGYATDFVLHAMQPLLAELSARRIRVITNAGGVNPLACRDALQAAIDAAGLSLKVAAVLGDDLLPQAEVLRAEGVSEMFSGTPMPTRLLSANAYFGAPGIVKALQLGADIVVTGRVTDSALALAPLMHEFGWSPEDYDRLSAGSLVGHILECGAQATGGLYTDWREVPGWDHMGFPIAEVSADGSFVVTKPSGTGGLITPATIAEQVVYEVGDPAAYALPDVVCDFSQIDLRQVGPDRVQVSGARGSAPGGEYKVSATYADGYRATAMMMIGGREAAQKGRAVAEAVLSRSRRLIREAGLADFSATSVEILGAEAIYGPHGRAGATREAIIKIAASHADKRALELFAREIFPAGTAMAQGLTGFAGGRPAVTPVVRLFSFLLPKDRALPEVDFQGRRHAVAMPDIPVRPQPASAILPDPLSAPLSGDLIAVPLIRIAHGRSGDKGDIANIGVLARHPDFLPAIAAALTAQAVGEYFAHLAEGPVRRFDWPGLHGFNFMLHKALGGGGMASLRHDPQGKTYAQILMDFHVPVPAAWLQHDAIAADNAPKMASAAE